jgi:hypothetical protein
VAAVTGDTFVIVETQKRGIVLSGGRWGAWTTF